MNHETLHDGLPDLLSIDNMANGAVYEMTTDALKKLAENIADVNTSPTQKRKIVITIEAAPYNDRSGAELNIKVENKLAGQKPGDRDHVFRAPERRGAGLQPQHGAGAHRVRHARARRTRRGLPQAAQGELAARQPPTRAVLENVPWHPLRAES